MQSNSAFNASTVDWRKPGVEIDASRLPQFDAAAADIAAFQRDGVVLLRGLFTHLIQVVVGI